MSKKQNFLDRLFRRGERAQVPPPATATASATDSSGNNGQTICVNGVLYRARLRAGCWESFGPPLGTCTEDGADV